MKDTNAEKSFDFLNRNDTGETDEQLCTLAQSGDNQALDALIRRYSRVVRKIARRYFLSSADDEDLIQEGMLGLIKAQREYRECNGTSFMTFAEMCIKTYIYTAIRSSNRKKHIPMKNYIPFEEHELESCIDAENGFGTNTDPEALVIDKEFENEFEQTVKDILSKFEAKVLRLYLNGFSLNEIADRLNISYKSADNAVTRGKRKLSLKYDKDRR